MVPSREPGRETGMESWVTEPRKGTCLEVFHPDFQERPEQRISIDAARCITVGRQTVGTQTGELKLCIDDTSPGEFKLCIDDHTVSRVHAVLVHKEKDVFLYDMSSNGTYINDARMPKKEYVKLKLGDTMRFGHHSKQFKLSLSLSGGAAKAKSSPSPKGIARSEQAAQPLSPSTDGAEVEREKTVTRSTPSSLTHSGKKVASNRNQTDETSAQDKEISGPGKAKLVEPHIKTGQMDTEIPQKKARKSPSKSPTSETLIARHGDAAAIVESHRKTEKAASSTSAADARCLGASPTRSLCSPQQKGKEKERYAMAEAHLASHMENEGSLSLSTQKVLLQNASLSSLSWVSSLTLQGSRYIFHFDASDSIGASGAALQVRLRLTDSTSVWSTSDGVLSKLAATACGGGVEEQQLLHHIERALQSHAHPPDGSEGLEEFTYEVSLHRLHSGIQILGAIQRRSVCLSRIQEHVRASRALALKEAQALEHLAQEVQEKKRKLMNQLTRLRRAKTARVRALQLEQEKKEEAEEERAACEDKRAACQHKKTPQDKKRKGKGSEADAESENDDGKAPKKSNNAKQDPNAPTQKLSAHMLWSRQEGREMVKTDYPDLKASEIVGKLGEMWRGMSWKEKEPWEEKDKEAKEAKEDKGGGGGGAAVKKEKRV